MIILTNTSVFQAEVIHLSDSSFYSIGLCIYNKTNVYKDVKVLNGLKTGMIHDLVVLYRIVVANGVVAFWPLKFECW